MDLFGWLCGSDEEPDEEEVEWRSDEHRRDVYSKRLTVTFADGTTEQYNGVVFKESHGKIRVFDFDLSVTSNVKYGSPSIRLHDRGDKVTTINMEHVRQYSSTDFKEGEAVMEFDRKHVDGTPTSAYRNLDEWFVPKFGGGD